MSTIEENELCSHCNGSGEGMYSDSTCTICKGRGVSESELEITAREMAEEDQWESRKEREREEE